MPMPRFYFHLRNEQSITDTDGTELPDIEAARAHALVVAHELMFNRDGMLEQDWSGWTMSVQDAEGREVFSFTLADAGSEMAGR